jgi:hypothetical protein
MDKARDLSRCWAGASIRTRVPRLRGLKTLHLAWPASARTRWRSPSISRTIRRSRRSSTPACPRTPVTKSRAARCLVRRDGRLVVRGGLPSAERFYDGLRLMARAASLGGVETLVSLPVHTSHHGYSEAAPGRRHRPGLVRVSRGGGRGRPHRGRGRRAGAVPLPDALRQPAHAQHRARGWACISPSQRPRPALRALPPRAAHGRADLALPHPRHYCCSSSWRGQRGGGGAQRSMDRPSITSSARP